ncbi:MAG: antibiotic biosynthesis monooxygenase [Oscillospiraceae bacterium]|nr:antibiotic biosynthesis monooxygenase [Oscillospiraceae bacterium]
MSITINIYYTGENGAAKKFAEEMTESGTVEAIRAEDGNLRYEYFLPADDPETVLLIDSWRDQAALDRHHGSALMEKIKELRDKYDLHMKVERFVPAQDAPADESFIRK